MNKDNFRRKWRAMIEEFDDGEGAAGEYLVENNKGNHSLMNF